MKLNITGRGIIPFVKRIAPAYNVDVDKLTAYKLLGSSNLALFRAIDGIRITRANIDAVFAENAAPIEEKVVEAPKPKKASKKKEEKPVEVTPVETPVEIAEEAEAPAIEEPVDAVEVPVEEEAVLEVEESVEEAVEEVAEEATGETEEEKPQYTGKKKKKNRNN